MYGYRLVWVNAQGTEKTNFFFGYDSMMNFVSARKDEGILASFDYFTN